MKFDCKTLQSFFLLIITTFLPAYLQADQDTTKLDSLRTVLQKSDDDTSRLEIYNSHYEYWKYKNNDSSLYYAYKAREIAVDIEDPYEISRANNNLGEVYIRIGNNKQAMTYLKIAEFLARNYDHSDVLAISYNHIGNLFKNEEDFDKALEHLYNALEINKNHNYQKGIADNINNIAVTYRQMGELDKAKEYFEQSHEIYRELGNLNGLAHTYNNIGIIYYQENKPQMALNSFNQVAKLRKELGQQLEYGNILFNIAFILQHIGEHKKAKEKCTESLQIAKSNSYLSLERQCYVILIDIHKSLGDKKKAYYFHKKLEVVADSLFNINKQEELIELKSEYIVEKERYEIELLEKENELMKNDILKLNYYLVSAGTLFILSLILLATILYNNRNKTIQNKKLKDKNTVISNQTKEDSEQRDKIKKYNEQLSLKQSEIVRQKDLLENKKYMLEQSILSLEAKNENLKSSLRYASSLQKSMMPQVDILKSYFKDVFVYYKKRYEVLNCFYWFNITDKNFIFAFVDTHNNGVIGAYIIILINDLLNKIVKNQKIEDTDKILNKLQNNISLPGNKNHKLISEAFEKTSICLLKVDIESSRTYFTGKNFPLINISNGKAKLFSVDKMDNEDKFYENDLKIIYDDLFIVPNNKALSYLKNSNGIIKSTLLNKMYKEGSGNVQNEFLKLKEYIDNSVNKKPSKSDLFIFGIKI